MKRTIQLLAAAVMVSAIATRPAQAQLVEYSTLYSFDGTFTDAPSKMFGDILLTFTGQPTTQKTPIAGVTNADLGTVIATLGTAVGDPLTGNIYLRIIQTIPSPGGNKDITGDFTGSVSVGGSTAVIDWNGPSNPSSIGAVTYTVEPGHNGIPDGFTDINPSGEVQTIRGQITVTPEPASMALLATGLAGVFGAVRRKRNA